jgi:hypothetical protein
MFGIKKPIDATINTRVDPLAQMKAAIAAAIDAAHKGGVPVGEIRNSLAHRVAMFDQAARAEIERRQYNPLPQMHDPVTLKPINSHEQAARAEEKRHADELRRQQREYRQQVEEAARLDDIAR